MELEPLQFSDDVPITKTIAEKGEEVLYLANPLNLNSAIERDSPSEWIDREQIFLDDGKVSFRVDGLILKDGTQQVYIPNLTDTNSMDPLIDESSKLIKVRPESMDEIEVGDIITYNASTGDHIIHRVVVKYYDDEGVYFVAKGDNLKFSDPEKIRPAQILDVTVAIIY